MRRITLPVLFSCILSFSSCGEEIIETENEKSERDIALDSLNVAEVIIENFDTTGVPLYYVPEEYTENSEKKIFPTTVGEIGVSMVKYCQTKEGGIEVNYQLKSGAKFRILYRDWAGRILVSKGDSIVNNYSFDKKDYSYLKDNSFWNDKILQDLRLIKMNTNTESVVAQFYVASPNDFGEAENGGITIQIELDSTGRVELIELP